MRSSAPIGIVLALALVAPADGAVRVSFGSTLRAAPIASERPPTCDSITGRDLGSCTRVALAFPAGGAVVDQVRAPIGGVIRRVRLRAGSPSVVRLTLARVGEVDADGTGGTARVVSRGTLLHVRGTGRPESHRVRLRVRRGDYLALQGSAFTAMTCAGDAVSQLVFVPALRPLGALERTDTTDTCTLLVQATVTARSR